jgi:Icc-related predicted phosphoesterase
LNSKPWTTLFVDGNHENHDMLDELETVEMFGADVGKVDHSIYHLRRGRIYDIDGNKCLVIGGAESTDRKLRSEGKSWWRQEAISVDDIILSLKNLEKVDNKVDYVLTHTPPIEAMYKLDFKPFAYQYGDKTRTFDPGCHQLQSIAENIEFKHWYFGHMHEDKSIINAMGISKYTCLYDEIIKLGEVVDDGW